MKKEVVKKGSKILVVAAHPDDETLGCGATIAKHHSFGDTIHVLVLADGVSSRGSKEIEERKEMCRKACGILGASVSFGDFQDQLLDMAPLLTLTKFIEKKISTFKPDIVYTHFYDDLNQDHRRTCEAVKIACRPQNGVNKVLFFEVPSSTEWQMPPTFQPNHFSEVVLFMASKRDALECYESEIKDFPHPRSYEMVESLAKTRGASVCLPAAEAFMLGRCVE